MKKRGGRTALCFDILSSSTVDLTQGPRVHRSLSNILNCCTSTVVCCSPGFKGIPIGLEETSDCTMNIYESGGVPANNMCLIMKQAGTPVNVTSSQFLGSISNSCSLHVQYHLNVLRCFAVERWSHYYVCFLSFFWCLNLIYVFLNAHISWVFSRHSQEQEDLQAQMDEEAQFAMGWAPGLGSYCS